jgi:hypothetical protein
LSCAGETRSTTRDGALGRLGRQRLMPVKELEKFVERNAARVLEDERLAGA